MLSYSEKALEAIEQQDLSRFQTYLSQSVISDPPEMLLEFGNYLENIGFLNEAKYVYESIVDIFEEVNLNLAQICAEDGLFEEAFLYLGKVSEDSPYYVSSLLVMADLYDMEGLSDVALEKLRLANQLSQDSILIFAQAEIEFNLERYQESIISYAKLDHRDILERTGVSIYQRIGYAYAALGKFEAAIEFLEKSIELSYDDQAAFELASLLYEQDEYQKAVIYLKQIDTLNPEFEGYEWLYAKSLHKEHKVEEALRILQQGLHKNSFNVKLLLEAAKYAYELKDKLLSERYLVQAIENSEDQEEALLALTTLYLELEKYENIISLYQDEIENPLTLWNIAKAYQNLEMEDKALRIFDIIEEDLTENPDFLKDYLLLLREFGYFDRAKKYLKQYQKLVPDDIDMLDFFDE